MEKQGTGETIFIDEFRIPSVFVEGKSMANIGMNKLTQRLNSS